MTVQLAPARSLIVNASSRKKKFASAAAARTLQTTASEAPLLIITALSPLTATTAPVFVEIKEPLDDVRTHRQL
jgi:hypothetical protein